MTQRLRMMAYEDGHGLRLSAWCDERAAVVELWSPGEVEALLRAAAALHRFPSGPLLSGSSAAKRRAEEEKEYGGLLVDTMKRHGDLWGQLNRALGARQDSAVDLLLECRGPRAQAVLWEALPYAQRDGVNIETARVARLCPGEPVYAEPLGWPRLVLVAPDVQDTTVRAQIENYKKLAHDLGLRVITSPCPPEVLADETSVNIVCCLFHGALTPAGTLAFVMNGSVYGVHELVLALTPLLRRSALVILDSCESGALIIENLASQMLSAGGCSAVLAPTTRWPTDSAAALMKSVLTYLTRGESLTKVVARGRDALVALENANPGARPWSIVLYVSAPLALEWRLPRLVRREETSGRGYAVTRLLSEALLKGHKHGFVGVEHLVLGMAELAPRVIPPELEPLRAACKTAQAGLEGWLNRWKCVEPPGPEEVPLSVRLRRILQALPPSAGLVELWFAVLNEPFCVVGALYPRPVSEIFGTLTHTVTSGRSDQPSPGANPGLKGGSIGALEVVGGPEDGARFLLGRPGIKILRAHRGEASAGDVVLYKDLRAVDAGLTRQHDKAPMWLGERKIQIQSKDDHRGYRRGVLVGQVIRLSSKGCTYVGFLTAPSPPPPRQSRSG